MYILPTIFIILEVLASTSKQEKEILGIKHKILGILGKDSKLLSFAKNNRAYLENPQELAEHN